MADQQLSPEAQAQLAKLATDLAHNPKTRKKFAGLVREIDPSKRFPDVEADDLREEMTREFEKRDQKRESERALAVQEAQRSALSSRYEEKDIVEIEKLMEKKGISSYEDGAILYAATVKPSTPTYAADDHRWTLPKMEIKDFGNLKQDSRSKAMQAVDDISRNRAH